MRVVLQRVSRAAVSVDGRVVAEIGPGLCLLVGIAPTDEQGDVMALADKVVGLRVFPDDSGRMNLSVTDIGGEALVVSQFTLLAQLARGRRPSFSGAGDPGAAASLIDELVTRLTESGVPTSQGVFGAKMKVELVNEGPVTLVIDIRQGSIA